MLATSSGTLLDPSFLELLKFHTSMTWRERATMIRPPAGVALNAGFGGVKNRTGNAAFFAKIAATMVGRR